MSSALWVLAAWLLFGGAHLLLSSPALRALLSKRLGTNGFVLAYTAIAAVTLMVLTFTIAALGGEGAMGLNLAADPIARWILGAVALASAVLMAGGLLSYGRSPMAELARRQRKANEAADKPLFPPATFAGVTRHPFFLGLATLMGAHALLAGTLASSVYFAGFAVLSLVGMPLQDRKLLRRHGDVYAEYLRQSSIIPFAAPHRQAAGERAWPVVLAAIAGALVLGLLHPLWRLGHGAAFAGLVLIGGLYAVARQLEARRQTSRSDERRNMRRPQPEGRAED